MGDISMEKWEGRPNFGGSCHQRRPLRAEVET